MAKIKGTDVLCGTVNSSTNEFTPFALAKSCSVEMKRDMQEVCSPNSSDSKDYIPMRKSWAMSIDCLLSNDESVVWDAYDNGTLLTVSFRDGTASDSQHSYTKREWIGTAYIKSLKASGRIHDMASFDISLQGSGALTYQAIPGEQ